MTHHTNEYKYLLNYFYLLRIRLYTIINNVLIIYTYIYKDCSMIIYTNNNNNNNNASLTLSSSTDGHFCFKAQKKFRKKKL